MSVPAIISGALVPATMAEAMQLATMMAKSKLVPIALQNSQADCLLVVMQAVRWEMDVFAVAQECSVIQGKLMHSGKLVAAVVNTRGNLTQRLKFDYSGEGPERMIVVSGQLQGETAARIVTVKLKNAKTTAKVWETQPDQQLMYHGARVWARRHTPELMLGVYSPEEFDDVKADAERDIANGTSIHHPDDYADGTPEKLTKPPEVSKFKRMELADQRWREKIEGWMLEVDNMETIEAVDAWASKHSIDAGSIPERHKDLKNSIYRKVRLKREQLISNMVVHEEEGERQATTEDFETEEAREWSISQRAIAQRETSS